MITLREMTRMINKKANQLKRIVVVDYRGGGIVFWGAVKDFVPLVTIYDTEETIKRIKRKFGFSLKNGLTSYRVRSFKPETEQYKLAEIMPNHGILDDLGLSCDYKNPVYILYIYHKD